jgi:hypothetical protein
MFQRWYGGAVRLTAMPPRRPHLCASPPMLRTSPLPSLPLFLPWLPGLLISFFRVQRQRLSPNRRGRCCPRCRCCRLDGGHPRQTAAPQAAPLRFECRAAAGSCAPPLTVANRRWSCSVRCGGLWWSTLSRWLNLRFAALDFAAVENARFWRARQLRSGPALWSTGCGPQSLPPAAHLRSCCPRERWSALSSSTARLPARTDSISAFVQPRTRRPQPRGVRRAPRRLAPPLAASPRERFMSH